MDDGFPRTTWTRTPDARTAADIAPDAPGVYVMGTVDRAHGLPVAQEWRQIAVARSLRDEFLQLDPEQLWTAAEASTELWYAPQPTLQEAIALERSLGRRLGAAADNRPELPTITVSRVELHEPACEQGASR